MGQSGNGKSTLINAIMNDKVAKTGVGRAITRENKMYSTSIVVDNKKIDLNLYDTVGLELSEKTTKDTLNNIEKHIRKTKSETTDDDLNLVWFCINNRGSRIQDFEIDLIKKLSFEYEIPFVIIMTKCLDNQIGSLENEIRENLPDVITTRILAEDFVARGGNVFSAYGVDNLLKISVCEYKMLRRPILISKLDVINQELFVSEWYINKYKEKAQNCIDKHVKNTETIGRLPLACIPFVHGICIKMISELHSVFEIDLGKEFAELIFQNVVLGVIAMPFMAIPLLSAGVACSFVEEVGEEYVDALTTVLTKTQYKELGNQKLLAERIKIELEK